MTNIYCIKINYIYDCILIILIKLHNVKSFIEFYASSLILLYFYTLIYLQYNQIMVIYGNKSHNFYIPFVNTLY